MVMYFIILWQMGGDHPFYPHYHYGKEGASFSPRGTLIFMSADEFLRLHNYLILCPLTNSILPLFINFLIHVMHRRYINSVWSRKWNLVNHLSNNYYLVQYY